MLETASIPESMDGVAVAIGPGAFTGVRLAIAVAQGLALAWDRPIVPVSTLAALAAGVCSDVPEGLPVLALLDARMGEVYAGWFDVSGQSVKPLSSESVQPAETLMPPSGVSDYALVGSGVVSYRQAIQAVLGSPVVCDPDAVPGATQVARLAADAWPHAAIRPDRVEAAYLRNKVALTSAEREAVKTA